MLSGKYKKFILNDINDVPKLFKQAINGDLKGYCTIPDREQFNKEKDNDIVIKLINSFGSNGVDFAFGEEIEDWKVYGQRMISMPSMYERRQGYRKFIRALKEYITKGGDLNSQQQQSLERLQSLQSLERLESTKNLQIFKGDYMDVPIPEDSVVYCDIPYINTDCAMYDGFNWDRYYKWLEIINHPVFTSEYTTPPNTTPIFTIKKRVITEMASGVNKYKDELLCLQDRYLDWYNENKDKELKPNDLWEDLEHLNDFK